MLVLAAIMHAGRRGSAAFATSWLAMFVACGSVEPMGSTGGSAIGGAGGGTALPVAHNGSGSGKGGSAMSVATGGTGASGLGASAFDVGRVSQGAGGSAGATGTGGTGKDSGAGGIRGNGMAGGSGGADDAGTNGASRIAHVFVIALENHDRGSIIGNSKDASYINGELLVKYASSSNFVDRLPLNIPSEPHYVWMEAGTNAFGDHTFTNDDAASAANSTASTDHLATQLTARGLTWMAYQEGIDHTSGACPIQGSGYYQPKHDPFVFFRDVSGSPPSKSNPGCVAHHKEYGALAGDLKNDSVASYNFITPNLCHDMHGESGCPSSNTIQAGDQWLRQNLPTLIAFCDAHDGVVFLVWDEGESTLQIPFLALGARVKSHFVSTVELDHGSLVRSVETIFDLPVLPKVSGSHDFGDLFQAGAFP